MNKSILILFFLIALVSQNSFAQYGYGSSGMGRNGYGNPNMQNNDLSRYSKSEADIEKERTENLNKTIEKLKTDLKLDDLQLLVIKREIEPSSNAMYKVVKSEISEEDKAKEIEAISERTDRNINGFLNDEQKEKYKLYVQEKKERIDKLRDKKHR